MRQNAQWNLSKLVKTDYFTGISILFVAYVYINHLKGTDRPVVDTTNGKLRGIIGFSRDYQKYHAYLGIPYAKPPVGELRFEPPQPPNSWQGVRDAGYYGSQCISLELLFIGGVLFGSEDCLFLNVFVKENKPEIAKKPVMVFIHGGMFHFGSAEDFGEKYFMNENVILITLTYRLGALGFLGTGDGNIRGNQGLKDQAMALQWIQKNIGFFSGDPNQVTVFGESAGGVAVGLHLLSPMSRGLFKQGIIQSGAPLTYSWGIFKQSRDQAKDFASKFNCPTTDIPKMVTCLKKLDARTLVYGHMDGTDYFRTRPMIFTPTVEAVNDSLAFIAEDPQRILERGDFQKRPLIMGVNAQEGLLQSSALAANSTKLALMTQFELSLPVTLQYEKNDQITNKITNYYFDKLLDSDNGTREDLLKNLTSVFGDRHFYQPIVRSANLYSKHAPLFLYYFNYSSFHSMEHFIADRESGYIHPIISLIVNHSWRVIQEFILGIPVQLPGSCHGSELSLLFNHPWTPSFYSKLPERDVELSRDLVALWTSFARSGNTMTLGKVRWAPVEQNKSLQYLEISKTPAMIDEPPFMERMKFWETIVDQLQEPQVT